MATAIFDTGYNIGSSAAAPFLGNLNIDSGREVAFGTAHFTTTATTCTIPTRSGLKVSGVLLTAATAGVVGLSWSVDSAGTVTITRTDTTSNGKFTFLIVYG